MYDVKMTDVVSLHVDEPLFAMSGGSIEKAEVVRSGLTGYSRSSPSLVRQCARGGERRHDNLCSERPLGHGQL